MKHYLVTGGAGFIGSHLIDYLSLQPNTQITCLDNFDPFYSIETKKANIKTHLNKNYFKLVEADICDYTALSELLTDRYDAIIHLAAKAGVLRPSLDRPREYYATNVGGTQNLLEFAKQRHIRQFVFASSSSVYGTNPNVPWSEEDTNFAPISPYASTKVSAEICTTYVLLHCVFLQCMVLVNAPIWLSINLHDCFLIVNLYLFMAMALPAAIILL